MALQRTRLADIQAVPTSAGAIYTNGAGEKAFVRGLLLHNTAGTDTTITLYNVPDSGGSVGTAGTGNQIYKVTLVANETLEVELAYALVLIDTNDTIQALASQAGATVIVQGDKDA